eukprot:5447444-Amphidinium_carterae.1
MVSGFVFNDLLYCCVRKNDDGLALAVFAAASRSQIDDQQWLCPTAVACRHVWRPVCEQNVIECSQMFLATVWHLSSPRQS